jgi:hypothetical protein
MDLSLIIFLIVVAVSVFRGYRSGIAVIISRVFSIAFAYAAALLFTDTVAILVQKITPLQGFMSYFAAGTLLFLVASLVFSSIFSLLVKTIIGPSKQVSQGSAIAGAALGGTLGCFIGILAVWFFTTFQGLLLIKNGGQAEPVSEFQKSAQELTGKVFKGIADNGTGDSELAVGAVQLLSNPVENIQHYKELVKSGELKKFFANNTVRNALDTKNPTALLNSKAFSQLARNQDFEALINMLNLSGDAEQRNQLLAVKVTKLWAQVQQVQNNPRFQEITNDPVIKQSLQSGNMFNLLNDKKIGELLEIISSTDVGEIKLEPQANQLDAAPKNTGKIHRWVDENGKVHYSDKAKNN